MSAPLAPGVYPDMSEAVYHADPCPEPSLSRSIAWTLAEDKTPRHGHTNHPRLNPAHEAKSSTNFDIGKAAHAVMLRQPGHFVIIEAADYKKAEPKAQRDAAYAAGKTPLLAEQHARVVEMVGAGRAQIARLRDGNDRDAFVEGKGRAELTLIWREDDVWLRCRVDWLADDGTPYEYKTAENANPETAERQFFGLGYDFQAAFYRRGLRALGLDRGKEYVVLMQEKAPPFALCPFGVPAWAMDEAEERVDRAIATWRHCLRNGAWPGYPVRRCYVQRPIYHEKRIQDREAREVLARDRDEDLRALLNDWQAPHPTTTDGGTAR